jgi:hypothetical protein
MYSSQPTTASSSLISTYPPWLKMISHSWWPVKHIA